MIAQSLTPFEEMTLKGSFTDLNLLGELLRSEIPVKIPILPPKRMESMFMDDSKDSLFRENEEEEATEIISILRYFEGAVYSMKTGTSVATIMKCVTCITGELWRTLHMAARNGVTIEYAYNSLDRYTGPETRPDETVYVNNFLMCRGEHSVDSIHVVTKKFIAKFPDYSEIEYGPWIRYLPAYIANRDVLRFFLVDIRTKALHNVGSFNLQYMVDRRNAVKLSLNIYRLLLTMVPLCPLNIPPLYRDIHGVIFFANYVFKPLYQHQPCAPDEVYALLRDGRIPYAIRVEKQDTCLLIRPKGVAITAGGGGIHPQDLVRAVSSVLKCLQSLHSHGFAHRDIRWNNVIRMNSGDNEHQDFRVIDFELAAKSGETMPLQKYVFEDIVAYGQRFFCHHDLVCLAKMIDFVSFQGDPTALSPSLLALRDYLASATKESSASEALELLDVFA